MPGATADQRGQRLGLHRSHGYHDIRWGDQLSSLHRAWTPCGGLASDDAINPASQLIRVPLRLNRRLRHRGLPCGSTGTLTWVIAQVSTTPAQVSTTPSGAQKMCLRQRTRSMWSRLGLTTDASDEVDWRLSATTARGA